MVKSIKTKLTAMIMAGVMVFAMAPLGAGVAFAGEENGEAAENVVVNAEEVVIDAEEDATAEAEENVVIDEAAGATVNAAGNESVLSAKMANLGITTINLANGPYKFEFASPIMMVFMAMIQEESLLNCTQDPQTGEIFVNLDGEGDDYDFVLYATGSSEQGPPEWYYLKKANTCTIKDSYTINLPQEYITMLESMTDVPEGYTGFYSGIKLVFNSAAPASKKANTLTLKGKTVKFKAKKFKKKAKTYAISKFVTVTKARGAVTYAKASGNKKITIAKNGTVTVKKKLKKGKYTVKVNVTAAGNATYNKVTKTVTFTIKVK